jgi:hypothetical protein
MNKFSAFNINSIPRLNNSEVDLLANVASKHLPAEGLSPEEFLVDVKTSFKLTASISTKYTEFQLGL